MAGCLYTCDTMVPWSALYMWMKWDRTSIIDDPWAGWGMDGVQNVSMAGSRAWTVEMVGERFQV